MGAQIEIISEDGALDLYQKVEDSFYITKQIHDLNNFETRNADFTNGLDIPATINNLRIMRINQDIAQEQGIPCRVSIAGVQIASLALLFYLSTEITKEGEVLKIQILYGNFNFFNSIQASDISQINWADLALEWEPADILVASQNTTDLVYAIADWFKLDSQGFDTTNNDINLNGFFIYAKEIIRRIIAEAEFTMILADNLPADFHRIALACPMSKFVTVSSVEGLSLSEDVENNASQTVNDTLARALFQVAIGTTIWDAGNNQWSITQAAEYTTSLTGFFQHVENGNRPPSEIRIMRNGIAIATLSIDTDFPAGTAFYLQAAFSGLPGDLIYVEIESSSGQTTLTLESITVFRLGTAGSDLSRTIQPSNWVPKMERKTFLVGILNMFNLVMVTNDVAKTVTIRPFNDIYSAPENNLSRRIDLQSKITIEPGLRSIGRDSHFTWEDDNVLRQDFNFTRRYFNDVFRPNTTVIALPFSACDSSIRYFIPSFDTEAKVKIPMLSSERIFYPAGSDPPTLTAIDNATGVFALDQDVDFEVGTWFRFTNWYRVIEKTSGTSGTLTFPTDALAVGYTITQIMHFRPEGFVPRLAIIHIDGGEANHYFSNGRGSVVTQLTPTSHTASWLDSLLWEHMTHNYYQRLLDAFERPQVIKASFILDTVEVTNADHLRPVYIEQFGANYYLNKIEQYKLNRKTRLELIRI